MPVQASHEEEAAFKRRRTAHACNACRARKSRCDGARPICNVCTEMGFECLYRGPAKRYVPAGQAGLSDYDNRLQCIENTLQNIMEQNSNLGDWSSRFPNRVQPNHHVSFGATNDATNAHARAMADWGNVNARLGSPRGHGDLADSVDGMGSITFTDEAHAGVFGPTSNSAFFLNIGVAMKRFTDAELDPTMARNSHATQDLISRPTSPPLHARQRPLVSSVLGTLNPYSIPPYPEAAKLVEVFFANTGQLTPYLSKLHILNCVSKLTQAGNFNLKRAQLCIVLMVMAFATSVDPSSGLSMQDRNARADVYFEKAKSILLEEGHDSSDYQYVQALLLITQYTQGTQKSGQTWYLLGVTINTAIKVGINRSASLEKLPQRDAEAYRRTWWMCFMMDRMCSMTFGRPPLLPNSYMKIPWPRSASLDGLEKEFGGENRTEAQNGSFDSLAGDLLIGTLKLYMILGDIIDKAYNNNLEPLKPQVSWSLLQNVFSAEEQLTEWKKTLPSAFTLPPRQYLHPVARTGSIKGRYSIIIWLRYNNVRTLLHRVVLGAFLASTSDESCLKEHSEALYWAGVGSIEACLNSATESLDTLYQVSGSQDLLPAWWYSIYYTFTSALAVFGGIVVQVRHKPHFKFQTHTPAALLIRMQKAITVLQVVGGGIRLATRCQKYLKRLMDFALSLKPCQESIQQQQASVNPSAAPDCAGAGADAGAGAFAAIQNPDADADHAHTGGNLPETSPSSLDVELGPFLMGEDLESFFANFGHEGNWE